VRSASSELLAARQLVENPLIHQFIEQQRKHDDLLGEELAAHTDLHQALERRGILVEERNICAAGADRLEYAQCPTEGDHRISRALERCQQPRHQELEPAACSLAEALHPTALAPLIELRRDCLGIRKSEFFDADPYCLWRQPTFQQ
jgi:hypothetical protein